MNGTRMIFMSRVDSSLKTYKNMKILFIIVYTRRKMKRKAGEKMKEELEKRYALYE